MKINQERWKKLEVLPIAIGNHADLEKGACIMEMVSYLADEPWSDHPKCACPILTAYAIVINDRLNDKHRQLLKPLIPLLVQTTVSDKVRIKRKRFFEWRNVTVTYPLLLDFRKLPEIAAELRKFKNTPSSMKAAALFLADKKKEIDADADADAYAYANANAYSYANANADANAYADADANAYAYANANAYAYSYAYAYALRDKIAEVAVETLRLAIEIKK